MMRNTPIFSPVVISSGFSPKIIATICLKNPTKSKAIKKTATIVISGYVFIPADRMNVLVRNIPNGGVPVIAKKPTINNTPVMGSVVSTPRTLAIFVELYFKNILPAKKKRADLTRVPRLVE